MRRIRQSEGLRRLSQEAGVRKEDFILPVFIVPGKRRNEPVPSMPDVSRTSVDLLRKRMAETDVVAVLLFGVPDSSDKDEAGSMAVKDDGIIPSAIRAVKDERSDLVVITDVCMCAYTTHGHCGLLTQSGHVDNDGTLEVLAHMAEVHASEGADIVAPSAMMDGQIMAIREKLELSGFTNTAVMSYAAKFASSFYGPFRDAAQSAPSFGDRRSYQISPANRREAVRDALLDEEEGADWLMVKPGLPFLDVLAELRRATRLPIAAYQVSGEYAMLKHAAKAGALDERDAVLETAMCLKRAGADAIITYYAEDICKWIRY